jgi:hypothetical protein
MERSATKSLSSLSLGPEIKVKCYNVYFVNGYVFHTEEYRHGRKTYNIGVCIKRVVVTSSELSATMGLTSSELEVDYYGRLEEVIELQYIIVSRIECFYSNVIGMTRLIEESELIRIMIWLKSTQKLDSAM